MLYEVPLGVILQSTATRRRKTSYCDHRVAVLCKERALASERAHLVEETV